MVISYDKNSDYEEIDPSELSNNQLISFYEEYRYSSFSSALRREIRIYS
jgi:hypothetical protein